MCVIVCDMVPTVIYIYIYMSEHIPLPLNMPLWLLRLKRSLAEYKDVVGIGIIIVLLTVIFNLLKQASVYKHPHQFQQSSILL